MRKSPDLKTKSKELKKSCFWKNFETFLRLKVAV